MQKIVNVDTSQGIYEVLIGKDLSVGELLKEKHKLCHVCVISDDTVYSLYGDRCVESLKEAGFTVDTYVFAHGEESKNIHIAEEILEFCCEKHLTRSDLMLALGGGVVGDITGFCAAIYARGIDFVQVPTTLLAAVDSSVGGKTAIDLKSGKNMAGAFHQPIAVFLDVNTFDTLPKSTFAEGMAEAIKYGMIQDGSLFELFESDDYDITEICYRCIGIKAEVVHIDEFDKDLRRILNFGHTPGHAIEKLSHFEVSHGNAVAIGMMMMTKVSEKLGKIPEGSTDRLEKVLVKNGLPTTTDFDAAIMADASLSDKKRLGGKLGLVLIDAIGHAYINEVPVEELKEYYSLGK